MGVTGLLNMLKPVMEECHVERFRGARVGIDGYAWLHKGSFGCALELAEGLKPTGFVSYFMHRVKLLQHFGVRPVVVFDGADLPQKRKTDGDRAQRRRKNMQSGREAMRKGDRETASLCFRRAIDVTAEMADTIAQELKRHNVEYIVAPYEADAQLALLSLQGYIESVITEDSDLIVYGCSNILFKMNKFGEGSLYASDKLTEMREWSFAEFTREMFVMMSCLAGCDFFEGVPGLGIRKAHAIVKKHRTFRNVVSSIQDDRKFQDFFIQYPSDFKEDFRRACLVFGHQTIWDPNLTTLRHLRPLGMTVGRLIDDDATNLDPSSELVTCLGRIYENEVAELVARGEIHPATHRRFRSEQNSLVAFKPAPTDGKKTVSSGNSNTKRVTLHQPCFGYRGDMIRKHTTPAALRKFAIPRPSTSGKGNNSDLGTSKIIVGHDASFLESRPVRASPKPQTPLKRHGSLLPVRIRSPTARLTLAVQPGSKQTILKWER
uniref:Exonuclease 1 n=1 Tax=Compsopogon caeruleus TaxID=31354 RepID=A0A7S1T5B9_9RHOD|mmetsp:Transcript_10253/g.20678  ORF Transcript_10253/g.20678 Transcript_10253/m.20678 type:complete len:491 (+) Transcript_10253:98-1570(+)